VISPLGSPLVTLGGEPELAVIDIDPAVIAEVRGKLPVLANARSF
jgi:predicted amidohydrolase